jgi:hypothetical protein
MKNVRRKPATEDHEQERSFLRRWIDSIWRKREPELPFGRRVRRGSIRIFDAEGRQVGGDDR